MKKLLEKLGECDLKRFVELYASLGVEITRVTEEKNLLVIILESTNNNHSFPDSNISDLINGYTGFYTEVVFDLSGTFVSQGFFE